MITSMSLKSNLFATPCGGRHGVTHFWSQKQLVTILVSKSRRLGPVYCHSKTAEVEIRKCSPFLESELLSGNGVLPSTEWRTVPDIWRSSAEKFGDRVAVIDPYHDPPTSMTYKQLDQEIVDFCKGLRVIGLKPNEKIALFADNSCRWLVADQGMMASGAINVVRGSRSSIEELLQLYSHSESVALAIDNPEMYNRIADTFESHAAVRFVILLWGDKSSLVREAMQGYPVYTYKEIIELGHKSRVDLLDSEDARKQYSYEAINSDDVATIVYTSGTTGNPKGVMLTHKNLLHQILNLGEIVPAVPGDRFLSMLPPWHAYERACEYFIFTHGTEQVYTTVKNLKEDLRRYQPHYLISVPLVYETLYSGILKQINSNSAARKLIAQLFLRISMAYMEAKRIYEGKCLTKDTKQPSYIVSLLDWLWARTIAAILWPLHMLAKKIVYSKIHSSIGISKAGISGGGSLSSHVDKFFGAIGIKIQNGYGLTESAPVIAARRLTCNALGSIGHPIRHVEVKVVNSLRRKLSEQLEWIPDSLGKLSNLVTLDLSENRIAVLPTTIGGLSSLQKLDLHGNRIVELPGSIGDLLNLVYLDLNGNNLKTLPSTLVRLTRLEEVDLSSNMLSVLPETVGSLVSLRKLIVETNDLEELPHSIGQCNSLKELRADYNRLKALPEALGRMGSLEILSVRYNNIRQLPTTMASLTSLKELNVSFNELESMPESLCFATTLVKLNISNNFADLQSLPRSIGNLEMLEELDMSNNQIRILPDSFRMLSHLRVLKTEGNPLEVPPGNVVEMGALAVVQHMADLVDKRDAKPQPVKQKKSWAQICFFSRSNKRKRNGMDYVQA